MSVLTPTMHPLLTQPVIDLLRLKKIINVRHFLEAEIKQIVLITNLTYKNVVIIQKHLLNKNSAVVRKGNDYYMELLQKSAIVITGIKSIDVMLGGGLQTGNIYEICGLPASGKTQLCLTIAKNIANDLKHNVYYIDTKGDFSGKKLKEMLKSSGLTDDQIKLILSKIFVKQIHTKYELINSLYEIKEGHLKKLKLRIVIIDSLPSLFYQTSNVTLRQGLINEFVNIMRLLTTEYHMLFILTNVITTWYEGELGQNQILREKLGLGKYWIGVPDTRLLIKGQGHNKFEISVLKSNKIKQGKTCSISISNEGFV